MARPDLSEPCADATAGVDATVARPAGAPLATGGDAGARAPRSMPPARPGDTAPAFADWARDRADAVERALGHTLPPADAAPARLHEAMRYAVLDGGKRIRPLLAFAAGELNGAPAEALARAACAVELIHAYSLVHDDLPCMDDDVLRRGKPTVHVAFGEATAMLVGDGLQALAFGVLAESAAHGVAPPAVVAMVAELAAAAGSLGMVGGQAIDLDAVGRQLTREQLEAMHRAKTGAMLRASVRLGWLAGGGDVPAALDTYAAAVGLAFQVVDDILDVESDTATLGKTAGKDSAHNKPTFVSLLGLEEARALAAALHAEAVAAVAPFGAGARRLVELADRIVARRA